MSNAAGYSYEAAQTGRLGGPWLGTDRDPNEDMYEVAEIATRAAQLVRNDPVMAALKCAKIVGTHGEAGLNFRSLVELDDDSAETAPDTTTDAEADLRRRIDDIIQEASAGTNLDACGQMHRREFDEAMDELATVHGEAFAVRAWLPDRPGAVTGSAWKLIRAQRVRNPPGEVNGPNLFEGITLARDGSPDGIWIAPPMRLLAYDQNPKRDRSPRAGWQWVSWYDDAGVPSVIHRIGSRPPGAYRGVSMYAPNLTMAKQTKGCLDAYVVAKRIQACHPIFIKCSDPNAAAKKDRNGAVWGPNTTIEPGKTYYIGDEGEVSFPSWSFQGADMREFLDTLYRNQFAAWGLPIDVVLAQLGETNMAASRSAWLQYYRRCGIWQTDHINQMRHPMDVAIVAEALAVGKLSMPAGMTMKQLMRGRYIRPARAMPDPKKEAEAVQAWADLGRDLTGLWAESGVDFRESTIQRASDNAWLKEYGVTATEPTGTEAQAQPEPTTDEADDAPDAE